jgi:hypothetical protein
MGVSILPEVLKPIRRQLGVSHRVLDVLVPEIVLQRAGIDALVRQLETAGVSEHVWMERLVMAPGLADSSELKRYAISADEGARSGGAEQQRRLRPKILRGRVSAEQHRIGFAARVEVPAFVRFRARQAPARSGDANGKTPGQPEHREIADDEGHETRVRRRMAFDQQPNADGDRLTDHQGYQEYEQQPHDIPSDVDHEEARSAG